MGKSKIVFRTIWNLVALAFILLLSVATMSTYDITSTVLFRTFLYPLVILLLAYHIYTSVMYYIYCFKSKGEQICFTNQNKSKSKTVISIVCLIGIVIFFILYTMSFVAFFSMPDNESTKFKEKVGFIELEISDYSLLENIELSTEKDFIKGDEFSFSSIYSTSGSLAVKETNTQEEIAKIDFEYCEKLPFYVSAFIYNEMLDDVKVDVSYHNDDGSEYKTTYNYTEFDDIKIAYRYIQCDRVNYIDLCLKQGDKVLSVYETWEQCVDIDAESKINEWIETFKNI